MKFKVLTLMVLLMTASVSAAGLGSLFGGETRGEAALIKLSGSITPTSSGFGSTGITPEQVRDLNQEVRTGGYDAVIYEINSGGGAVVASKEVKRSIESMKIPTVCRFRDISASGAYLISLGCDRVVADSSTLTGSIGVRSSYLEFSGLLDKIGVQYINITAGKYKEVGSQYTNATEEEKQILKQMAEQIQNEFIGMVEKDRNLTETQVSKVETARVFLGDRAKELGLVDRIGGRATAVNVAENITEKDLKLREIQKRPQTSLLSLFLSETGLGNFLAQINTGLQLPLTASY